MKGPTAIRLAALLALGYGLWVLAGGPVHLGGGSGAMTLRVSAGAHAGLGRLPSTVTVVVLALLLAFVTLLFMPKARAACSR